MARIALLTQLTSLVEHCAAIADSIGIALDVLAPQSGGWQDAVLILLGEDVVDPPNAVGVPTVLIAPAEAHNAWVNAARLGVDHVALLPAAAEWLTQRMITAVEPPSTPATTVGIVGGSGGAGASVLACAIARHAAGTNTSTVLLDADPLGGGLDLVLGCEDIAGLRWPALTASKGRLRPSTLTQALPRFHDLAVLSWDREGREELSGDVFDAVLTAAQQAFDLVVVDLPRHAPADWARACHHLVLVTPARVRAAVAAARVARRLADVHPGVRLVVRETDRFGLDPELVAETIGLDLIGTLHDDGSLAARIDRGEGIPAGRTHLSRFAELVLTGLAS
ncbi:septum formation initiator [Brevibacterium daeguense]|uniref:Septum formation initiator n=1 Tax=Brevibacterium daeguense TaxID=909936 RepID=A0ABP8EL08_9MICO|nr:septum site-determining protein Ssd [Brevibacterium daeguense]